MLDPVIDRDGNRRACIHIARVATYKLCYLADFALRSSPSYRRRVCILRRGQLRAAGHRGLSSTRLHDFARHRPAHAAVRPRPQQVLPLPRNSDGRSRARIRIPSPPPPHTHIKGRTVRSGSRVRAPCKNACPPAGACGPLARPEWTGLCVWGGADCFGRRVAGRCERSLSTWCPEPRHLLRWARPPHLGRVRDLLPGENSSPFPLSCPHHPPQPAYSLPLQRRCRVPVATFDTFPQDALLTLLYPWRVLHSFRPRRPPPLWYAPHCRNQVSESASVGCGSGCRIIGRLLGTAAAPPRKGGARAVLAPPLRGTGRR